MYQTDSGRSKLYDVGRDPNETRELSFERAQRIEVYRDRAEQWAAEQIAVIEAAVR